MAFNHGLKPGDTIMNDPLTAIFQCSTQGGMRRSLLTKTLIIISDTIDSDVEILKKTVLLKP